MPGLLSALWFVLGFVLLLKGAEWLIDGSTSLARRAGISELIVGLTLVSFGTSLPEFFINVVSRFEERADITIGDILGSNVANVLLVLGISAAARPLAFRKSTMTWEIPFALALAAALPFLAGEAARRSEFQGLTRSDGLVLLTFFALFLFYVYRSRRVEPAGEKELPVHRHSVPRALSMTAAGVPALALGAKGVVEGAVAIASSLGIPESVLALTIVAVGTSLPELAASVLAALKKRPDIAVGNVVGSNIFNISWILGVSSLVRPLEIPRTYFFDMGAAAAATALLFASVFFGRRGQLGRANGVLFVLLYAAYAAHRAWRPSL